MLLILQDGVARYKQGGRSEMMSVIVVPEKDATIFVIDRFIE